MSSFIIGKNLFSIRGVEMDWFKDAYLKMRSKMYFRIVILLTVEDISAPPKQQQKYFNMDSIGQLFSKMLETLCWSVIDVNEQAI